MAAISLSMLHANIRWITNAPSMKQDRRFARTISERGTRMDTSTTSPHAVTCPQERRKINRRAKLKTTYDSKEWELAKNEFTGHRDFTIRGIIRGAGPCVGEAGWFLQEVMWWFERKKPCEMHLKAGFVERVSTLPHHPYLESYKDGTYANLYLSGCMVVCNRCHYAIHHGMVLCKRCGTRYHGVGADMCKSCWLELHPEIVEARLLQKEKTKKILKQMREDSKPRECNKPLRDELGENHPCTITIYPSTYHCKDCKHLGDLVKIKRKPRGQCCKS